MEQQQFNELMQTINEERAELCGNKSKDYATVDVLSNFKRVNSLCQLLHIDVGRSPADCARFLMMLKIDRWCSLARKSTRPTNESIGDTILDLHNYIDLAYACEVEFV